MRVSIIVDDNAVNIDGVRHTVDLSDLPAEIHAVQWNNGRGEIEYRLIECEHCNARGKKSNEIIKDLTPYMKYVDAWNAADMVARAREAERVRQVEAAKVDNAAG